MDSLIGKRCLLQLLLCTKDVEMLVVEVEMSSQLCFFRALNKIDGAINSFGEKDVLAQVGWLVNVKSIAPWAFIISRNCIEYHADSQ